MCEQVVLEGVEADDGRRTEGGQADGGIQNQKQEPHTKKRGKIDVKLRF